MIATSKRPTTMPKSTERLLFRVEYVPFIDLLASEIGCRPLLLSICQWLRDPRLMWTLYFGPLTPYQYRLFGPKACFSQARQLILTQNSRILSGLREPYKSMALHKSHRLKVWLLACGVAVFLHFWYIWRRHSPMVSTMSTLHD
jgi:hypothetical protein